MKLYSAIVSAAATICVIQAQNAQNQPATPPTNNGQTTIPANTPNTTPNSNNNSPMTPTTTKSTSGSMNGNTSPTISEGLVCPFQYSTKFASTVVDAPSPSVTTKRDAGSKASDIDPKNPSAGGGSQSGSRPFDPKIITVPPKTSSPGSRAGSNANGGPITTSPTTLAPGTTAAPATPAPRGGSTTAPSTIQPIPASRPVTTIPSTPATSNTSVPSIRRLTSEAQTGSGFKCDSSFYNLWKTNNVQCGGKELDVPSAVRAAKCVTYNGVANDFILGNVSTCISSCYFPACVDSSWNYQADNGLSTSPYRNINFLQFLSSDMQNALNKATSNAANSFLSNFTLAVEKMCNSFSSCSCPIPNGASINENKVNNGTTNNNNGMKSNNVKGQQTVDMWEDGSPKTKFEQVAVVTSTLSTTTVYASVAVSTTMVVASSVGAVSSTTAASAAGLSAGASISVAGTVLDMAQFAVCTSQLNLEGTPKVLLDMGSKLSFSTFAFFKFGQQDAITSNRRLLAAGVNDSDSLDAANKTGVAGMYRYANELGVKPDMIFYLSLAGLAACFAVVFTVLAIALVLGYKFAKNYNSFKDSCWDRAIGAVVLLAIVSQYAIGVSGTFQICLAFKTGVITAALFIAIAALVFLALGVIFYGVIIVKNNEHELMDIGTKDHFEKACHRRYGALYDEYNFENRFFFAPKMALALFAGITTGMVYLPGTAQILVLIFLHITFLLYMEVRQPHLAKFVQHATTLVTIMKIAALGLGVFLISSTSQFSPEFRLVIGYFIMAMQGLVILGLLIRQIYIFYKTYQLKRQNGDNVQDQVNEFYSRNETPPQQALALNGGNQNRNDHYNDDEYLIRESGHKISIPRLNRLNRNKNEIYVKKNSRGNHEYIDL